MSDADKDRIEPCACGDFAEITRGDWDTYAALYGRPDPHAPERLGGCSRTNEEGDRHDHQR